MYCTVNVIGVYDGIEIVIEDVLNPLRLWIILNSI